MKMHKIKLLVERVCDKYGHNLLFFSVAMMSQYMAINGFLKTSKMAKTCLYLILSPPATMEGGGECVREDTKDIKEG